MVKIYARVRGGDIKFGIAFTKNGKDWYFDTEVERDAEYARLIAAGVPVYTKSANPPDPENT